MKTKPEFSFKALTFVARNIQCQSPVAVAVRKSCPNWVIVRLDKAAAKATQIKAGAIVSTFVDETNRALLFLTDQRPAPAGARKAYGKDGVIYFELPRQDVLAKWFPVGPIRPVTLIEASHGRLVVQVPGA